MEQECRASCTNSLGRFMYILINYFYNICGSAWITRICSQCKQIISVFHYKKGATLETIRCDCHLCVASKLVAIYTVQKNYATVHLRRARGGGQEAAQLEPSLDSSYDWILRIRAGDPVYAFKPQKRERLAKPPKEEIMLRAYSCSSVFPQWK